jgi:hypothetical protein
MAGSARAEAGEFPVTGLIWCWSGCGQAGLVSSTTACPEGCGPAFRAWWFGDGGRSGRNDEAELPQNRNAVVEADFLGDEAVLDLEDGGASEAHRLAGGGWQ